MKRRNKIILSILILVLITAGVLVYFNTDKLKTLQHANDLVDGTYIVSISENDDPYHFQYNGDIYAVEDENRSIQRKVYNFQFLGTLVDAYEITNNEKYIESGMSYIRDFTEQEEFDTSHMTWHDETTAGRLNYFLSFYQVTKDELSEEDKQLLEEEMLYIAELIAYTDFYSGNNNHGMYQDNAIVDYAIEFDNQEILDIGSERLANYFLDNFDKDGVHLENSPEYHFHMVHSLKSIIDSYDETVLPYYNDLLDIYEKSVNYASMIVLPSGVVPNVGDSKNMAIDLSYYYAKDLIDQAQKEGRATYYESGYDIVRHDDTYLMFRGGYLKNYHHHNDDLSFWLYKDGNIFTEVGAFGYDDSNYYDGHAVSFQAHNTLIVDGQNEAEGKDVFIVDSGDANVMSGETSRIKGVNFKRDITFNDDLTEFTIDDTIDSEDDNSHTYELLFHLDPSIDVNVLDNNTVELIRDGEIIGEFTTDGDITIEDDVYFPYYYADPPEDTKVIVVTKNGADVTIQSQINLK